MDDKMKSLGYTNREIFSGKMPRILTISEIRDDIRSLVFECAGWEKRGQKERDLYKEINEMLIKKYEDTSNSFLEGIKKDGN